MRMVNTESTGAPTEKSNCVQKGNRAQGADGQVEFACAAAAAEWLARMLNANVNVDAMTCSSKIIRYSDKAAAVQQLTISV